MCSDSRIKWLVVVDATISFHRLCCALDVCVPCLTVLCSTVLSATEASLSVFQQVLIFHLPLLNKMATAYSSRSWLNFFCGV